MTIRTLAAATLLAAPLAGVGLATAPASAMPMIDTAPAALAGRVPAVENVRWVCGPFGCVWRHRHFYRPYPAYGYGYGYGYHRPWHHGWGAYHHPYGGYGWRHHGWHRW